MRRLARYVVGPLLGEGGAGAVYRATLQGPGGFDRPVALKVLRVGADQLRREARLGGLLRHSNLVDVYEVGEDDGQWFCAMELCDGALTDQTPLPPRAVVEVGLQVCDALRYAHEELGLIHMDLKPANLLHTGAVVKVADLGIARSNDPELHVEDGRVRGTLAYMPPEQRAGRAVDSRADLYALGVTLVELATGLRPRVSGTVDLDSLEPSESDTLDLDSLDRPHAPDGLSVPQVPDWLAPAVERCLAADPADRWPDMSSLAAALRQLDVEGPGLAEALGVAVVASTRRDRETNLVAQDEVIIGRSEELRALGERLSRPGLLTIKGPAGVGKTRLARAAGYAWLKNSGSEAWFCDLSEAREPQEAIFEVARRLKLPLARGAQKRQVAQAGHALACRGELLLVLDNCEQLQEFGDVLGVWLESAPTMRVLVTSREPLRCSGEEIFEVGPLGPGSARELLVDRARRRGVDIEQDPDLDELAEQLDGLPLALELAAGRLGVLSVRDVLERMGLSLLRAGTAGRHGTLHAALEWSWGLLAESERSVLAQLSVFAGGFELVAAEEVVQVQGALLDLIQSLMGRSLVTASDGRLRLMKSVRAFASTKLSDRDGAERRHGVWYAQMGTLEAVDGYLRRGGAARLRILIADRANLSVACSRAVERGDTEVAVDALCAAWAVLGRTGPYEMGIGLSDAVRAIPGLSPSQRARVELIAAQSRAYAGRSAEGLAHHQLAVQAAVQDGSPRLMIAAEGLLATRAHELGKSEAAESGYLRAIELARAHDLYLREALFSLNYGNFCRERGQHEQADVFIRRALEIHREVGNRLGEGQALGNLASLQSQRGHREQATRLFRAALAIHREVGNRRSEVITMGNLGAVCMIEGRLDEAAELFEASLRIHEQLGFAHNRAVCLGNLGILESRRGRHEAAVGYYQEARLLNREVGNRRSESYSLGNLASTLCELGRFAEAEAHLEEALVLVRDLGDVRMEGAWLGALADVYRRRGRLELAERTLALAEAKLLEVADPALLTRLLVTRAHAALDREDRSAALDLLSRAEAIAPRGDRLIEVELDAVKERLG